MERGNVGGRRVVCRENEGLVELLCKKRQELADKGKGLSENLEMTLQRAYSSVCTSKTPITTLKDLSLIKGVGKWILRLMREYFETDSGASQNEELITEGKKPKKAKKRYVPQKNSVAYALLLTLYKGIASGCDFMRKQELIDAAEASGLSRVPIVPEKVKGKPGQFGSSPRDWYSGWSCMKTLITKGLVAKSSCPAKYMLTEEGKDAARDCLWRSGQVDLTTTKELANLGTNSDSDLEVASGDMDEEMFDGSVRSCSLKESTDFPPESLERFLRMGYAKDQVISAFNEVSEISKNKDISSLWPSVLCHLREQQVYHPTLDSDKSLGEDCLSLQSASKFREWKVDSVTTRDSLFKPGGEGPSHLATGSFSLRACSSNGLPVSNCGSDSSQAKIKAVALPPLAFGEKFEEAYDVILILDNREKFAAPGSRSRKIIENIRSQFKIRIKVRKLPVGDAVWIAKHRNLGSEYVLDFIVERKKIDDLRFSIRDNRYKDQKLRLLRCGLKKLMYVVEGDPNSSEAAESIKTACFTTEILEGFDVQRTNGLGDTLRRYGFLTQAITQYYKSQSLVVEKEFLALCPAFREFTERCENLEKITVSDVFAIQLMQVPQVTENIADAVLDLYPTLLSLVRAYSLLDGDNHAQEEMLKNRSNNAISAAASRNIYKFVWGS